MVFPLLLPHYKIKNGQLYSLSGKRIDITEDQISILKYCDGKTPVKKLELSGNRTVLPEDLESLQNKRIITLVNRSEDSYCTNRSDHPIDILVLSPHIDDAALSIGGIIHKTVQKHCRVYVLNIFSRQIFQTGLRVPENDICEIALQEDAIAGDFLGYASINLPLKDCQQRYHLPANKLMGHTFSAIAAEKKYNGLIAKLKSIILNCITDIKPSIIFSCLGLGGHLDHLFVAQSIFSLLKENQLNKDIIVYYEDLPYAAAFPWDPHTGEQFTQHHITNCQYADISNCLGKKINALKIFCTRIRQLQINAVFMYAKAFIKKVGYAAESCWCQENGWSLLKGCL